MRRWIRRIMLVVFWAGVGAIMAGIVGFILGAAERAVLPFVLGMVAATTILPITLIMGAVGASGESLASLTRLKPEEPPAADLPRELARIESLRERGVTVRNMHHLYDFTVTVFPEGGAPRREVFSQLITMGQLPNFFTGRYVVIASTAGPQPQLRLDPSPDARWAAALRAAPVRYDEVVAPTAQPPATRPPASAAEAPPARAWRTALNLAIVAVCLVAGFAGSVMLTFGGFERMTVVASELPKRWTGQVHGTWDSAQLDLDLADLRDELGDRGLVYLYVFDGYYSIAAYSETDSRGEDVYAFRGGAMSLSWTSTLTGSEERFTIDQVNADVLRLVAEKVYAETPDAEISNVGVRSQGGRLIVSVSIDGAYESTTRTFDAVTGEAISEG